MWFIQDKIFGEEQEKLEKALKEKGIEYKILSTCLPISNSTSIFRGGTKFNPNNQYLTIKNYTYSTYTSMYNRLMLNCNFIMLPWWALYENYIGIFNCFPKTDRFFIRPNSGEKIFTGTTLSKKWFIQELNIILDLPNSSIRSDDLIIISSAKNIKSECRVFISNRKIIDYCFYEGEIIKDEFLIPFIEKVINLTPVEPDIFWVLDLAYDENRGWRILEINNGLCAGWYDMNYSLIIDSIEK